MCSIITRPATLGVKFAQRNIIINDSWVRCLRTEVKNTWLKRIFMKLFGNKKDKEIEDLKDNLEQAIYRISDLEYKENHNKNEIETNHMLYKKYPNEILWKHMNEYKEKREELESKGYTLQGCVNLKEVWINKGDKNG
jgi:hypothetical protein